MGSQVDRFGDPPMTDLWRPPTSPQAIGENVWAFPRAETADDHGVVAIGADLEPETIIGAYRLGLFPMPISQSVLGRGETIGWWSPRERGVLMLDELRVTRSLRRSCRRYQVTINQAFDDVTDACANSDREGDWISPGILAAYRRLHRLGWAHSIEVWDDASLVGGLYGIQLDGLFAGESMFHRGADASKVALVALVAAFETIGGVVIDTQWHTDHLATLGVRKITQGDYSGRLEQALASEVESLAKNPDPTWVAKSAHFLDRTGARPMEPKPPKPA